MKFSELKHTAVVSTADAQELGHIESAFLDLSNQTVVGLRIRSGGVFTHHRALLLQDVQSMGEDAVTIEDPGRVNDEKNFSTLRNTSDMGAVVGAKVLDTGGTELGNVADVEFDSKSGSIERYILTANLTDRLRHREHFIEASSVQSVANGMLVANQERAEPEDSA